MCLDRGWSTKLSKKVGSEQRIPAARCSQSELALCTLQKKKLQTDSCSATLWPLFLQSNVQSPLLQMIIVEIFLQTFKHCFYEFSENLLWILQNYPKILSVSLIGSLCNDSSGSFPKSYDFLIILHATLSETLIYSWIVCSHPRTSSVLAKNPFEFVMETTRLAKQDELSFVKKHFAKLYEPHSTHYSWCVHQFHDFVWVS